MRRLALASLLLAGCCCTPPKTASAPAPAIYEHRVESAYVTAKGSSTAESEWLTEDYENGWTKIIVYMDNKTIVDRGWLSYSLALPTGTLKPAMIIHSGSWRMGKESFGNTVYLYDGDMLKARIINPSRVVK